LLDDQRFARNILPDEKQLSQVMIRRLKSDLVDADGKPLYARVPCRRWKSRTRQEEREIHEKLDDYCEPREGCREEWQCIRHVVRQSTAQEAPLLVSRRVRVHSREARRHLSEGGQRKDKDAMAERILRKAILRVDEDYANDQEVENAQAEAVEEASRRAQPLTAEQQRMLDELRRGRSAPRTRPIPRPRPSSTGSQPTSSRTVSGTIAG
jgi:hypothetical protein